MNLYDEAIEENKLMCDNHIQLTKEKYSYAPKVWERRKTHYTKIEQALTRAKKEHELLGLYREIDNHINNWENYDRSCDVGYIAKLKYLQDQIKALEEEMK